MKIVFLHSAARDIVWMREYYRSVFPAGSKNAKNNYLAALNVLRANAYLGHRSELVEDAYEYHIPRTPFTLIYRICNDQLEVLRLLDGRSGDSIKR